MKLFIFVFLITLNLFQTPTLAEKPKCFFTPGYEVYIVNNLPQQSPPLMIHCASKNNDLGNHTLYLNQEFYFKFCESFIAVTIFSCQFSWDSKKKDLDVFNANSRKLCKTGLCYWAAKSDGIYFSNDAKTKALQKAYDWEI